MNHTKEIMEKYKIVSSELRMTKETLKGKIRKTSKKMSQENILEASQTSSKTKHWLEMLDSRPTTSRPNCMNKLNRKQCNAILTRNCNVMPKYIWRLLDNLIKEGGPLLNHMT